MEFPDNLLYSKDHEWVSIDKNIATIGITEYAQEQMGDIVFVEMPAKDQEITQGEPFGVVESVKSVSDCLAPLSGKVLEVNEGLTENPATVNDDCYGEGWLVRVQITNKDEIKSLLKPDEYAAFVKEETA